MRLELTGRHVEITPALRRLLESKLTKLERLLNDSAVSAQAVLSREKYRFCAEITLHARGEKFLHGVGRGGTWGASVVQVIDKIAQQAQKVKGKWQARKRPNSRRPAAAGNGDQPAVPGAERPAGRPRMPRVFHASRQAIKSMSVTEAARELDARDEGLVIFRDPERGSVSVLYRQRNGEFALVETEA